MHLQFTASLLACASFVFISADAFGIDHLASHFKKHGCDGNCTNHFAWHPWGFRHSANPHFGSTENWDATAFNESAFSDPESFFGSPYANGGRLHVDVQSADGSQWFASGVTRSAKVEYGPLKFTLHVESQYVESGALPTEFRLFVDGLPAHPEHFKLTNEWLFSEQGVSREVQWNCPPLGKHTIQFEVRLSDQLVSSEPLWIEIVAPAKPEVVAVGSIELGTSPIKNGEVVKVHRDSVTVRFAMPPAADMLMHNDRLEDTKANRIDECCFEFSLKELSIGRHALRFSRVVGDGCAMTSEPSNTLWIQYEPAHSLYSLRNENAIRRKVIVDEIRKLSVASRPSFDEAASIFRNVNSNFVQLEHSLPAIDPDLNDPDLNANLQNRETERVTTEILPTPPSILNSSYGVEVNQAASPSQSTPTPAPPQPSPSDVEESLKLKEQTLLTPDPNGNKVQSSDKPQTNSAPAKSMHDPKLVTISTQQPAVIEATNATVNAQSLDSQPNQPLPDQPSTSLRKVAQQGEDLLSKFEDDLRIAEAVWHADQVVSHVIFDAPAYFTQNGYGTAGQEDARSGLVLLEGMELSTQANGHWELKIPYIKSKTPVVLHLQIQFKTDQGEWKPLTIQPICFKAGRPCIDPNDCGCSDNADGSQSVRCACAEDGQPLVTVHGFSPLLRREVGVFTDVRRRGSAVFGHGYSALQNRQSF